MHQMLESVASPAMGHWGTCPPPFTSNNFILVHLNLTANYPSMCSLPAE